MAKKSIVSCVYNFRTVQKKMLEATNIVRWNPAMAILWMKEAKNRVFSPVEMTIWNESAKYINKTCDNIESQRYYVKKDFWFIEADGVKIEIPPERIELI